MASAQLKISSAATPPVGNSTDALIAELIEDDEVETLQTFDQLPGLVHCLFLLKSVNQIGGGEETFLR